MYSSLPMSHSSAAQRGIQQWENFAESLEIRRVQLGGEVVGNFKLVAFLMGLQGDFIKFPCYLCLWNNRATIEHYQRQDWPQQTEFSVGKKNIKWEPLLHPQEILFPPLHIKLYNMK